MGDERSRQGETGGEPADEAARAVRTCPNCGRTLTEEHCKLRCPDPACGFFLSCADYL